MKNFILTFLCLLLFSCKSTEYIEIPVDRVKIEYKTIEKVDTIIKNDSIIIKSTGDTVFLEKYQYIYKIKIQKDTISNTDTITVVQPVETIKEVNKLTVLQKILIFIGLISVISIVVYIFIKYYKKK